MLHPSAPINISDLVHKQFTVGYSQPKYDFIRNKDYNTKN